MTKSFDRLLGDALHERAARPAGQCLDAETIAAWFDAGLAGQDRTAAEAHVANCARCQAMLAAMARTAPSLAPRSWRPSFFGWLVPLTVAAAAVVVWVNLPERAAERFTPAARPAEVAADNPAQKPTVPTPAIERAAPPAARREPPTSRNTEARKEADAKRLDLTADARTREINEPAKPAVLDQASQAAASATPQAPDSPPPTTVASAPPSAVPAAQPPPPAALAETMTAARAAPVTTMLRATPPQMVIESTDGSTRWRIGPRGPGNPGNNVQRSTDGGRTWQTQATGVNVTLTAGVSPSPSVCWLVGQRGVVLITIDGRQWQRLDFPETVDLVSIRATDDKTATVTASDGRLFTTTDRGRTWER